MLAAVAAEPRTVGELASEAALPRRLVLEVLIRLMRAGWIVLDQRSSGVVFSASSAGLSVVDDHELPSAPKRIQRVMNFVIDKITGTLYRSRELPFYPKHILEQRAQFERLVWMEPRPLQHYDDASALVSTLLDADEKFIAIDPAGDRLVDRYALATVRNGVVEGLPKSAPPELTAMVLQAAGSAPETPAGPGSPVYEPAPPQPYEERDLPAPIRAVFQLEDLVIGGQEHERLFHEAIRRAKYRLVIHSTFISADKFALVRHLLHDAAKRGAVIDILWGEDEDKTGSRTSGAIVRQLREETEAAGLSSNLRIHSFSTRSHAKIVVADDGREDKMVAMVGSCNWLSSGFHSFDASVRLRDPRVIAVIFEQLAELTRGADGHWTELTNDFARVASDTRRQVGPKGAQAELTIVLGPQHAQYVRTARDTAVSRLFVTSHRLGAATRPAIVVPAIAAANDRGIKVDVYYGVHSGGVTRSGAAHLTKFAADEGVRICPVEEPRLHAKMLAWDDDHLLLTSQNWLSADPSDANLRREIGVYIRCPGAGRAVVDRFEALRKG
jgi:cardiolipin synthase A/B